MPYRLSEVPFEGVTVVDGCFHAVYIANNRFALGFLIPDAAWLPGEVRRALADHLDPWSFAPIWVSYVKAERLPHKTQSETLIKPTTMPATCGLFYGGNMITFKPHSDLQKLDLHDPARPVMEELVKVLIDDFTEPGQTYSPDDSEFLVLIGPGDTDRELTEIDMPKLSEIYWEGASMRQGFIYAVYLGTDD